MSDIDPGHEEARPGNRKIFVVHGHDAHLKEVVARFIERLGFTAIIIAEQPSAGRTLIEQVEQYSDVEYAVVLLTPDDIPATSDSHPEAARARQNVVFELGFFVGRLGRSRVHCLRKGNTQIFSDIDGVIWTPADDPGTDWRIRLAQEMSAAGLPVDLNKAFRN
ncbi:MAG TPA: nucleotide-binding protein [Streptosporangiaceae bacterium]|nr:nucleotide-binding protein [Streptosporangiaceae bacterium]